MKKAKRIIVMSLGIILLAGIIPQPTDRSSAAAPDELRSLKAENKALRAQVASLQKKIRDLCAALRTQATRLKAEVATLKAQNAALKAEVAKLKRGRTVSGAKARTRPTTTKPNDPATPKQKSMPPPVKKGIISVYAGIPMISKVPLRNKITQAESVSENKLLSITVVIFNLSEKRKLHYRTWGAHPLKFEGASAARLTDDLGNVYKRIHFGGIGVDVPLSRTDEESIYPGKHIRDVLIFELPVAKAKRLILSLPLGNLGQTGTIEIIIPAAAIMNLDDL